MSHLDKINLVVAAYELLHVVESQINTLVATLNTKGSTLEVEGSINSGKYVRTEEKLGVRSYVVEYHGYSAEDVKLLINQEG